MLKKLPGLPPTDWGAAQKAWRTILKPEGTPGAGTPYTVFLGNAVTDFFLALRWRNDADNEVRTFVNDIKGDVDEHSLRLGVLESKVAALEAQPITRFP